MATTGDELTLDLLEEAWTRNAPRFDKIDEAIILFQQANCTIFINEEWGPPVPYRGIEREHSTNYGYRPTKGNRVAIEAIPEIQGWPEFKALLLAINHPAGPYESIGCERAQFPSDKGDAKVFLGSYINIICSDYEANNPSSQLTLAVEIGRALDGLLQWWGSVEIGIERMKHLSGVKEPWCMMLKLGNYGPDEDKAREGWSYSAHLLERMFYRLAGLDSEGTAP